MTIPPVAALEIGTSKVMALVGEMREDGSIMIIGSGEHLSSGVRKGEVTDLENVVVCVRSVLKAVEKQSGVSIEQIHLAVSGGHIRSFVSRGARPVQDPAGMITEDDVEEVMDVARAISLSPDRETIHTIPQQFCIDEQERVVRPEGMEGARLAVDMLVLHGVRSRLNNLVRVVERLSVDVQDVAFSALCSALAVLTPEQKKIGVVVIDLGGGTTDYMAYAGGVVASGGALGIGGDHITNDIALAFNIPMSRAESLKKESGSAVIPSVIEPPKVSLPAEVGFPGKKISLKSLHTVINARMEEILLIVKRRLSDENVMAHIGAGIVLTGGGAHLTGITELVSSVFGVPCFVGKPQKISGLALATDGPEYAACAGLIQYGFRTQDDQDAGNQSAVGRFVRTLFGG